MILLNILGLFGLYGQDLILQSFSRIPEDTHHDQSHTMVQPVSYNGATSTRGWVPPTPEMGCSHTHVKPTAKVKRDGSVSHQGSGVTNDQSHTMVIAREGGYYPPPEMGCSHTHVKPTAKVEQDGSVSPSIEEKAIAIR